MLKCEYFSFPFQNCSYELLLDVFYLHFLNFHYVIHLEIYTTQIHQMEDKQKKERTYHYMLMVLTFELAKDKSENILIGIVCHTISHVECCNFFTIIYLK